MSKNKIPYKHFSKYILRAPLFSLNFFKTITRNETIYDDELKNICQDKRIKEAIFLASPVLSNEIGKWVKGDLNEDKSEKIKYSVFKYLSRMSSRCTPFGLFAGTAVGEFSEETSIELDENFKNKRHTRLDMNYLVALTQTIEKVEVIRNQLKFYSNTSLYKVGNQFRYVEYTYINTKRIHHIVGANHSSYLETIIQAAKKGKTIEELAVTIAVDDISLEEALDFVSELVENQILISELEPSVSGPEFLEHILSVLKRLHITEDIISVLEKVDDNLLKIDESITNDISDYFNIGKLLKPLNTAFELKYLFQTDMILSCKENTLSYSILKNIKSTLRLLNKISFSQNETPLSQFKTAFYERYETRPMALSKVLDKELGISFLQNNDYGDVGILVDDINLPPNLNTINEYKITSSAVQDILQNKLIECIITNNEILNLNDQDFAHLDLKEDWSDLPDTMSTMVEFVNIDGNEKISMSYLGGSSAINLLGRFCHGDDSIKAHVKQIIDVETKINKDKIIAEIVHLPESRVGNILFRPHLRDYEIPYLANSTVNEENQITIEDIEIKAQNPNDISIRSKKHNKEIIPRLSNAHNYSSGALPVYQFLASTQNKDKRNGIGFSWGGLANMYDFLPRVEYNNVILSYKLWNLKKADVQHLIDVISEDLELIEAVNTLINTKKLPQFVMLKDGDNELLINFNNLLSVKMLIKTIRNRAKFQLKEFLHTGKGIVKESTNIHSNQVVVSFFNEEKLMNSN